MISKTVCPYKNLNLVDGFCHNTGTVQPQSGTQPYTTLWVSIISRLSYDIDFDPRDSVCFSHCAISQRSWAATLSETNTPWVVESCKWKSYRNRRGWWVRWFIFMCDMLIWTAFLGCISHAVSSFCTVWTQHTFESNHMRVDACDLKRLKDGLQRKFSH